MDASETRAEEPGSGAGLPAAAMETNVRGDVADGGGQCSCPKCALYKWYPPLLLLSTLMAGVFCCMYISKPVFLSQPRETAIPQAQPAYQQQDGGGVHEPPTAQSERMLDPAGDGLPGEAEAAPRSDSIVAALAEGGERVVIERDGPPLFEPFELSDDPGLPAFPQGDILHGDPPAKAIEVESEGENSSLAAGGGGDSEVELAGPPRPEAMPRSDGDDFQIRASFMAEFVDPSKSPADKDGGPGETEDSP